MHADPEWNPFTRSAQLNGSDFRSSKAIRSSVGGGPARALIVLCPWVSALLGGLSPPCGRGAEGREESRGKAHRGCCPTAPWRFFLVTAPGRLHASKKGGRHFRCESFPTLSEYRGPPWKPSGITVERFPNNKPLSITPFIGSHGTQSNATALLPADGTQEEGGGGWPSPRCPPPWRRAATPRSGSRRRPTRSAS